MRSFPSARRQRNRDNSGCENKNSFPTQRHRGSPFIAANESLRNADHTREITILINKATDLINKNQDYTARGLVTFLYGISKKHKDRDCQFYFNESIHSEFLNALQDAAINKIYRFNPQELASSIYAFAKLEIKPKTQFISAWQSAAISQIEQFKFKFNPQALANSIYAFAKLEIKPDPQFIGAWQDAAINKIYRFNPQALANSIYALAKLGIKPDPELIGDWQKAAISQIEQFNPQALANSIYAFAKLGIKPDPKLISAWQNEAISQIEQFNPISQIEQFKFNPQELANSIYAFAILGIKPDPQFIGAWQNEAISQIEQFNPQDLATSIYAFAKLGIKPDPKLISAWQAAAINQIQQFNPQALANSIYAFAILGIKPDPKLISAWQAAAISQIDKFNLQELANSIYAFAILGIKPDQRLINMLKLKTLALEWGRQLIPAYLQFPDLFHGDIKQKIIKQIEDNKLEKPESSQLHLIVSRALETMNISHENEKWIPEIANHVDIFIDDSKYGKGLIIQVDGPSHFLSNPGEQVSPDGPTQFNTKMLIETHYTVVRIPYWEIHKYNNYSELGTLLKEKLQGLGKVQQKSSNDLKEHFKAYLFQNYGIEAVQSPAYKHRRYVSQGFFLGQTSLLTIKDYKNAASEAWKHNDTTWASIVSQQEKTSWKETTSSTESSQPMIID